MIFSIMIVTVFTEIIGRSIFSHTFLWSSELAMFGFMWLAFLGSAVGVLRQSHFVVDLLFKWFSEDHVVTKILEWFTLILILVIGFVFLFYGIDFVKQGMSRISYAIGIKTGYNMLVMPITGALFILNSLYLACSKFMKKGSEND